MVKGKKRCFRKGGNLNDYSFTTFLPLGFRILYTFFQHFFLFQILVLDNSNLHTLLYSSYYG